MGRGHWHPSACKVCGKSKYDGHHVTQKGYCIEHAVERTTRQMASMVSSSGMDFQEWRRAMAASVGAVLLDDVRDES